MQQKTVSTMQPLTGETAGAAVKLLISRLNVPTIQRIDGYVNGVANTQYWLMFFAGTTVPADTTKPIFELMVLGVNGFSWDFSAQGGLDFTKMSNLFAGTNGLIVALSSTSATLTASAVTMDILATVNEPYLPVAGMSVAGDLTTARVSLLLWLTAAGPKNVFHIDATNNVGDASTQYLMLFPANPAANQVPLASWPLADTATLTLDFGSNGFRPFQQTAANPPVVQKGCTLGVSTDATKYVVAAGTPWTIRAFYK